MTAAIASCAAMSSPVAMDRTACRARRCRPPSDGRSSGRIRSAGWESSLPFRRRGLVADTGAIWFLTRELGTLRAKDLIYSARTVAAEEALALGLATEVVDDAALESRALERAQELAAGPTFSLGLMRKLFAVSRGPTLAEYLEMEGLMSPQLRHTEDFHEGIQAFKEKRKPKFNGR